jgi:hypothetical protein
MTTNLLGFDIIPTLTMVNTEYDWSGCRSQSRAKRRWLKRGILGCCKITSTPRDDVLVVGRRMYCHPAIAARLKREIAA